MTDYPVEQATQAELDAMSPQQVLDARAAGSLDQLLGLPARPGAVRISDESAQLTADDIPHMTTDEIVAAKRAGRFDRLLGRMPTYTYPANLF